VIAFTPRAETPADEVIEAKEPEKAWLSREAAAQLTAGGMLGDLFVGVTLGGSPPSAEIRERVAAFARANDVTIDFEIVDDELVAIRAEVTFGGCCGYEGVEALGSRLGQPNNGGGCGIPKFYYDNWTIANEDGTHVRVSAQVNRMKLRWERTVSLGDVVTRADRALGADRGTLAETAGDRWSELESGKRYRLEVPYEFGSTSYNPLRSQPASGLLVTTDRRIVTEVSFMTNEDREETRAKLKKQWGKPRVAAEEQWIWYRNDRVVVAVFDGMRTTVTLSRR